MRFIPSALVLLLTLVGGNVSAQVISAQTVAESIQNDSGSPKENYLDYGERLAQTLSLLTPAQLARVMTGTVVLGTTGVSTTSQASAAGSADQTESPDPIGPEGSLNDFLDIENIGFNLKSSELDDSAYDQLDKVAEFLITNPDATIEIEGHVSIDFKEAQSLSEARAESAKQYLVDAGLDPNRIETIGKGFAEPSGTASDSKFGASADRRIEFTLKE